MRNRCGETSTPSVLSVTRDTSVPKFLTVNASPVLDEIQNADAFREGAYRATVKCVLPDQLKVRFSALQLNDLRYLLGDVPDRQDWLLGFILTDTPRTRLTCATSSPRSLLTPRPR